MPPSSLAAVGCGRSARGISSAGRRMAAPESRPRETHELGRVFACAVLNPVIVLSAGACAVDVHCRVKSAVTAWRTPRRVLSITTGLADERRLRAGISSPARKVAQPPPEAQRRSYRG